MEGERTKSFPLSPEFFFKTFLFILFVFRNKARLSVCLSVSMKLAKPRKQITKKGNVFQLRQLERFSLPKDTTNKYEMLNVLFKEDYKNSLFRFLSICLNDALTLIEIVRNLFRGFTKCQNRIYTLYVYIYLSILSYRLIEFYVCQLNLPTL